MTKNPILNAITAALYIVTVSVVMSVGTRYAPKDDGFMAPVAVMSLFTLSAAVMGYVFLYQPALMVFDGKKKSAVTLFLQTVGVFGFITAVVLGLLFAGAFR